ncbi:MAG: chlorophyll synthase [Candidatus Saccharibacteria bacterium]|nr:chlorophyll synthase [Candidatus Saccharibacteria bacterium]
MQQSTVHSLARSLRLSSTFLPWIVCCSVLFAYHVSSSYLYVLASLLLAISYGFVTIHNDLSDREIDIKNQRRDIPLANNQVSRKNLQDLLAGLLVMGYIIGVFLGATTLLWLSMYFFLGWLYSGPLNFKSRGRLAVSILGICYGVMPWLLGYSIINQAPSLWSYEIMVASFIFAAGIISLKDFKDIKGDTLFGKRTLLVTYGPKVTHRIIIILTSVSYLLIALATYTTTQIIIFVYITIAMLFLNFILLSSDGIKSESRIRKRNGSISRTVFFLYAATLSIMNVV